MVDCETTIKKYDTLRIDEIAELLDSGHEIKIEYIAQTGCWGRIDSENQPIKEPFGIIRINKGNQETVIKLNPSQMVDLINFMAIKE